MRPIGGKVSIFDRMKSNGGYMSSPFHSIQGMAGDGATPDDAETSPGGGANAAPNYREAEQPHQDCQECEYLDENDDCTKYGFTPKLYWVCDSFEPQEGSAEVSPDDQKRPAMLSGMEGMT